MAKAPAAAPAEREPTLEELEALTAPSPAPPAPPPKTTTKIMLLGPHIFLPIDPTAADWASPHTETKKYDGETDGRRTRLEVHPSLAQFLQERKQAETLDD